VGGAPPFPFLLGRAIAQTSTLRRAYEKPRFGFAQKQTASLGVSDFI
jgi:hypothetical protein